MTGDFETWWTAHTREYRVTPKSAAKAAWDAAMNEAARICDSCDSEDEIDNGAAMTGAAARAARRIRTLKTIIPSTED